MKIKRLEIRCERDLINTLDSMYQLAKNGNKLFYDLIELMKNEESITTAIHNIKANKGSKTVGVDKKDIDFYLQMKREKLVELIRNCIDNYYPKPVRRVFIPKGKGAKRPLGIPAMIDRIIQKLAKNVLEPIVEAKFYKHSYGFRPFRSSDHAMARILSLMNKSKCRVVIEGDIKGFFDNLNHNKLMKIMWGMGIRDKRYLSLIKKMLKAGVMDAGKIQKNDLGTSQGGIISPILANIYLNGFDWMIANMFETHPARKIGEMSLNTGYRRVRRKHKACYLVRYADDRVIFCEDREQADVIHRKVEKYLKHVLHLELSKEKTLITDLTEKKGQFLGFEFFLDQARLKRKKVGKIIPQIKKLRSKVADILHDIKKLSSCKHEHSKGQSIELINAKIVGVSNYFAISNCTRLFSTLDHRIDQRAYKTFSKMYGSNNYRNFTTRANQLNNRVERHKGKSTRSFYIKIDGTKIGISRLGFTRSRMAMNFKPEITPYTDEGRRLFEKLSEKRLKLERPIVYSSEHLKWVTLNQIKPKSKSDIKYNFEYLMNREYVLNRDRGKCKACATTAICRDLRMPPRKAISLP